MFEGYLSLWVFIVLMVSTPGPANLLIMTAAAQHGFWRCMPFNMGLISGKLLLNAAMALGLTALVQQYPAVAKIFAVLSALYMSWLALRGWNAHLQPTQQSRVLRFREGLIVHPLSPKTWVMGVLAFSEFLPPTPSMFEQYLLIPLSFAVAQLVFHSLWCLAGVLLQRAVGASALLNRSLSMLTVGVVIWAVLLA
ncbi:MAG: LysE family transporter [Proteobacteria bacterium]|nr:LysE family transporter [Pseudomonadota bacterium]